MPACWACGRVVWPLRGNYCEDCEASGQAEYDRRDRAMARGEAPRWMLDMAFLPTDNDNETE